MTLTSRLYDFAKGVNPSGSRENCGAAAMALVLRIFRVDSGAVAGPGTQGLNSFEALREALLLRFSAVSGPDLYRGLDQLTASVRSHGNNTVAIVGSTQTIGGEIVEGSQHFTVVWNTSGIIRFMDPQTGGPALYPRASDLVEMGDLIGRDVEMIYEALYVIR